jgi:voltage-gated potassium channel
MLADPRTDEMISDTLRENIDQIRTAVHGNAPQRT